MRAMILAAGKGERMRPLTDTVPKCLLRVKNLPLICYHLQALSTAGIQEVVINLGYLGEKIKQYLGNGQAFGISIEYSWEDPVLETAGGIKKALPLLGDSFIAISADIFTQFEFHDLCLLSKNRHESLAHLVLTPNPSHHPKGDFGFIANSHYLSDRILPLYNFGNIALYQSAFFDACPEGVYPLGKLFKQSLINQQLTGELYSGLWYNVGTPQQLYEINHLNNIGCHQIL